ncbi:MAG: SGNH/GDSL hydrolase family protein [Saprospiraceae bacterium]|nr:SGNH/GDSL hydrolase family protein [Saprospiraceae bacterium]
MKFSFSGAFLTALCLIFFNCTEEDGPAMAMEKNLDDGILKVLFLGNSHTFYNDLPSLVVKIARAHGYPDSIFIKVVAPGGYTLADHLASPAMEMVFESELWDAVVIQENATISSLIPSEIEKSMIQPAYGLAQKIKSNHPDTRIIWYMTHAYSHGISPCGEDESVCSFAGMLDRIRTNYLKAASVVVSEIAPAGVMWKILFKKASDINLHDDDDIHPNILGSWVSAATIYAILFQQDLDKEKLELPQTYSSYTPLIAEVINRSIFDQIPDWRIF